MALDSVSEKEAFRATDLMNNRPRKCLGYKTPFKVFAKMTGKDYFVLNQVIRPFTAKWHKLSVQGEFSNPESCQEFREELAELQAVLNIYTKMLGDMAGIEDDLSELEYEET
jgi:hypothetical protein